MKEQLQKLMNGLASMQAAAVEDGLAGEAAEFRRAYDMAAELKGFVPMESPWNRFLDARSDAIDELVGQEVSWEGIAHHVSVDE
jgi:hypothetical protein